MPGVFETLLLPGAPPGFGAAGSSGASGGDPGPARRGAGTGKPLLAYDPAETLPRVRRLTQVVAGVFNSLSRRGYLVSDAGGEWAVAPNPFVMGRDPLPTDDAAAGVLRGDHWVNLATGAVWFNLGNSTGAAAWARLAGGGTTGAGLTGTFTETFP